MVASIKPRSVTIGIIGGGFAGLAAAYELLQAGHQVTVFEAAPQIDGLAAGFKANGWDWWLEKFYHHIFTTDRAIIDLAQAIGAGGQIFWNKQTTAFFYPDRGAFPVTLTGVLRNPQVPFADRIRFGLSGVQYKLRNDWQRLEQITAEEHLTRWAGKQGYERLWKPLLDGKFGPYAPEVNAAWMWARAKTRSFKLGYFKGGFQTFANVLAAQVQHMGGTVRTSTPVQRILHSEDGWQIATNDGTHMFERVIVASSPQVLTRIVPDLPDDYTRALRDQASLGAVVMVASLDRQLITNGAYWFNLQKGDFPFLALVEHTNMIDRRHYNGDRLIYCGDYLPADHRYFGMSDQDVVAEWVAALPKANPDFKPEWIKQTWVFREKYAQPVVLRNHGRNVPSLRTPLDGLYFASLAHVYPWDRGTNFAVELGQRVAREAQEHMPAPQVAD